MLNQTLKKFYSLLMPSRKTTYSAPKETSFPSPTPENNTSINSARILYPQETKNSASHEKANAAEHDWWIN